MICAQSSKYNRKSRMILNSLKEHGPLTQMMLHKIHSSEIEISGLRKSLQRLTRKNLIETIQSSNQKRFYMISQDIGSRSEAGKLLKCSRKDLKQATLRRQDLFHHQWCEYWISIMKRHFPNCEVIRESIIGSSEKAQNVLLIQKQDQELRPDFILKIPVQDEKRSVFIAFEIERSRKSNARIVRKLIKYRDKTRLDGLIYICGSGNLAETIRLLYRSKLADKSTRLPHFKDNFFQFSGSLEAGGPTLPDLKNACGKPTSFEKWCGYLSSTPWEKRKDSDFS